MSDPNKLKKDFEKINSKIGATIVMTPDVYDILGTLYHEEEVLVKDIEVISNNEYKIKYIFPIYNKSKIVPDHVSVSQMGDAIMHGAFMVLGLYIKNNPDKSPIDFTKFLKIRMNAIYLGDTRRFTKKLKFGEYAYLLFHNIKFEYKKGFYIVTVQLKSTKETFVRGESQFILEEKYI